MKPAAVPTRLEDLPLTLTVREVAAILGIGINQAYAAVRSGEIGSVRIGGRLIVPRRALLRLLGEDE